jgi:hypothetical protein
MRAPGFLLFLASNVALVFSCTACNALLDIPEYEAKPGGGGGAATGGTSGSSGARSPCQFAPGDFTFETSSTEGFEVAYAEPSALLNSSSLASEDGSLRMRVGFDGQEQQFYAAAAFLPPVDYRGKSISACVRLLSNVDDAPDLPAIELFASSGDDQSQAYSSTHRFDDTDWFVLELLTELPSREDGPYDASDTRSIGFALGTDSGSYGNIVVDVDGISIRTAP